MRRIPRPFTEPEIRRLRIYYPDLLTAELARVMGRHRSSIYGKASALGLRKSAAFLASSASGRLDGQRGVGRRFAPGHSTWNKGMKGWHAPGTEATRFSKDHRPQTWVPVGTEVVREGYLTRKISDDKRPSRRNWKAVHVLLWEQHHGAVPRGGVVCFRDGDCGNIRIENLALVGRDALCLRNSVHNLPPELKAVITAKGALNRTITLIERKNHERKQHPDPASASV
jgi:hypothetical protein